jgi:hypothetical protein
VDEASLTVICPPVGVVTVNPFPDTLLTVPEVPPGSLTERALDPEPPSPRAPRAFPPLNPGAAPAVVCEEPEVDATPMAIPPPTASTTAPATIAVFRRLEKSPRRSVG